MKILSQKILKCRKTKFFVFFFTLFSASKTQTRKTLKHTQSPSCQLRSMENLLFKKKFLMPTCTVLVVSFWKLIPVSLDIKMAHQAADFPRSRRASHFHSRHNQTWWILYKVCASQSISHALIRTGTLRNDSFPIAWSQNDCLCYVLLYYYHIILAAMQM